MQPLLGGSSPNVIACGKLGLAFGADRDDQVVVGEVAAARAAHELLLRPHLGETVLDEGGPELVGDIGERVRAGVAQ